MTGGSAGKTYNRFISEPSEIEKRSFEIISERLKDRVFPEGTEGIIKRVIHTTADFEYADNLVFSKDAVLRAEDAIREGAVIVTDTEMALSGINKRALSRLGCRALCFMADPEVSAEAERRGVTRAMVSMERASKIKEKVIFAIGNAPTALIALHGLIESGAVEPALIIGVPVGFVNVIEAKELILNSGVPHIVARGNKGGSTVAAAVCNAILYDICGWRR